MVLVKNFYLLHFRHSLLPLYIGAPTDAKRPLHSTLCSGLSRNNNIIFLFQPDLLCVLFQQFPLKGVVVATAPQVLVNMIVEKAIRMADHMNVPVVALVENMSYYECPDCGTRHEIFGKSEVEAIAKDKGIDTWTRVPMDPKISAEVDAGKAEDIEGDWYKGVADKLETL